MDDDGNAVSGSDDATVTVTDVGSSLAVSKTADPTSVAEPGGEVTFTVRITNTSLADTVTITEVVDSVHGDLDSQGTCVVPQKLAPGAWYECAFTATVSGNAGDTETNVVTASGVDDDGNAVSGSDDATVKIVANPVALQVLKVVNWNGVPQDEAQIFEVCIVGPSHPSGSCQTAGPVGGMLLWPNLIPGVYTVTETTPAPAGAWTVEGSGVQVEAPAECPDNGNVAALLVDGAPCWVSTTITNTRKLGSLRVTKLVEWNGVPADRDQDFQICIQGPSFPTPNCKTLEDAPTGGALTWLGLIPGVYTVTETAPAPVGAWTVQINPAQVTVPVDGSLAHANVTNSRKAPRLVLDKEVVGEGDAVNGLITFTLRITNTGPTALKLVPLTDVFTGPVQFVISQPPADAVADNRITWNNLVAKFGGRPLPPGGSYLVSVTFRVTSAEATFNMDNTGIVEDAKDIYDTPVPRAEDTVPLRNKATAVTLLYFVAEPTPQGIRLRWETAEEIDNYGFRLRRSTTGRLEDAQDIGAFIPAQGHGQHQGASYEYLDTNVTPGQQYTYWLVDVDVNGKETVHPESAVAAMMSDSQPKIFLPVIAK